MRELERRVVLSVIDRKWREHLYEMDYLKEGIGLRAMAQRDPLVEYQNEGFAMYQQMMGAIREETVGFIFNLEVKVETVADHTEIEAKGLEAPDRSRTPLTYVAPNEDGAAEVQQIRPRQANRGQGNQNGQQKPGADGAGSSFFKN